MADIGYGLLKEHLDDAVEHFQRKVDYGELTQMETIAIRIELVHAFECLLNRELSEMEMFINRANATMNTTAH